MRILATLLRPDAGHAWVAGLDVVCQAAAVRRVIGGPTATHIWHALAWLTALLAITIPAAVPRYHRTAT